MISPLAFVDPEAKLGNNITVHPFAFIDKDVEIGDNCEIMPYASIMHGSRLGSGIKVFNGAVVGADPQDFRWKGEHTLCKIGDNAIIREKVIVNRSIHEEQATIIGANTVLMAETHIGHDSDIAEWCVLGNGSQIAGDVKIGFASILSTGAKVNAGSRLGDWVFIKGGCRISGNVPPFVIMAHNPAVYYGVNAMIMRDRAERFTEEEIDDIAKAYRHIYQCNVSLFNAVKRIQADIKPSAPRDAILKFIQECNNKIIALPKVDMYD